MNKINRIAAFSFIIGIGFFVFGGTNALFSAEDTGTIEIVSSWFKISIMIGVIMIITSLILFGLAAALTKYE